MAGAERVFVVERARFFGGAWPQGFVALAAGAGQELIESFERSGFFAPRAIAEDRPDWKQLIPYCLVARQDELLCVQRLRRQGEGRLHGLWSIGFGGHVNPGDGDGGPTGLVMAALGRELREELRISGDGAELPRLLGLLNDDGTDVGKVHAGLVYRLDLPAATSVAIRETAKMQGCFRPLGELNAPHSRGAAKASRVVESLPLWQDPAFESWSAIMLESGLRCAQGAPDEDSSRAAASKEESHNG